MEPKTRTKIGPKSDPKMQSGAPYLYGDANKDIQCKRGTGKVLETLAPRERESSC